MYQELKKKWNCRFWRLFFIVFLSWFYLPPVHHTYKQHGAIIRHYRQFHPDITILLYQSTLRQHNIIINLWLLLF